MNKSNKLIYILFTLILTFLFTINVNAEENSNKSQIIFHLNTSTINFTKNETTKDIDYNIKINVGNETLNNTTTAQGTMYTVSANNTVLTDLHNSSNTIPVTLTNNKTSKYVSLRDELNSNGVINASINTNNKAAEYIGSTTINFQTHDYYMYKINFEIDGILYDSPEENMVLYDIKFGSNAIETDISTGLYRIRPLNEEITINNIRAQEGYEYIGNETVTSKIEGATVVTLRFNKIWNINYVLNDGILENSIDTYTYTDATFSLPTPTREGYTFTGWTGGKNIFYSTNYNKSTYSYGLPMFDDNEKIIINSQTANSINFTINYEKWKYVITNEYQLLPNTKYIISFHREDSNDYKQNRNYVYGINNEGEYEFLVSEGDGLMFITAKGDVSITFITNSTGKTRFAWGIGTNGYGTTIDISNILLEEGNKNTVYEEYISEPTLNINIESNSSGNRTYVANWKKNPTALFNYNYNAIKNADFSDGLNNWNVSSSNVKINIDNNIIYNGKPSLHIYSDGSGIWEGIQNSNSELTVNSKSGLNYLFDICVYQDSTSSQGGINQEVRFYSGYTSKQTFSGIFEIEHTINKKWICYHEKNPHKVDGGKLTSARIDSSNKHVSNNYWVSNISVVLSEEKIYSYSSKLSDIPIPTREGYGFEGWFTEKSGGTKIDENTIITEDTTFYAHWVKNIQITLDSNGGTGGTTFVTGIYGKALPNIEKPIKESSRFLSYSTSNNYQILKYDFLSYNNARINLMNNENNWKLTKEDAGTHLYGSFTIKNATVFNPKIQFNDVTFSSDFYYIVQDGDNLKVFFDFAITEEMVTPRNSWDFTTQYRFIDIESAEVPVSSIEVDYIVKTDGVRFYDETGKDVILSGFKEDTILYAHWM